MAQNIFCTNCGQDVTGHNFCVNCGTKATIPDPIISSKADENQNLNQTPNNSVEDWISIIQSEDDSEFENPFYSLEEHKTSYYLNDELVFDAWEIIICVYDNEDYDEHGGDIYLELISGSSNIKEGLNDEGYFESFIINNCPEHDYQELTNGRGTIAEGNIEEIAKALADFKYFDHNDLLEIDKQDFTYFNHNKTHFEIKTPLLNDDKGVDEWVSLIIGSEVYVYGVIFGLDEQIKKNIDFSNFVRKQQYVDKGFNDFELPENNELVIDENGIVSNRFNACLLMTDDDKEIFSKLEKRYDIPAHELKWFTAFKDLELPDLETFKKTQELSINMIKNYLNLFARFNYPAYTIILNKLYAFHLCIWDIYPNIIDTDNTKGIIDELKGDIKSRIKMRRYESEDLYHENNNEESEEKKEKDLLFEFKTYELRKKSYIDFTSNLNSYLKSDIETEKIKQKALDKRREEKNKMTNLAYEHGDKGVELYNENDLEGALAEFNKAIEYDDNITDAFYMKALINKDLGNINEALLNYNESVNIDTNNLDARLNRAFIHFENKDFDSALVDYNYIINVDDNHFKAHLGRATTYNKLYEDDLVLKDCLKLIEIDSKDYYAYKECARIYFGKADLEKGSLYAKKYLELKPDDLDFKNLVDQLTSPTKTEQIEEDLYYFEKVTHKNDEGLQYTEFAIWNCYCQKDSSDEWDYDTFEKDIYLEIKYFDTNNNEVSESEFDDFYDNDPNSTWEIQFISNNLNDVKEKMSLEISSFKKLHEKKGILNTKKPIQFKGIKNKSNIKFNNIKSKKMRFTDTKNFTRELSKHLNSENVDITIYPKKWAINEKSEYEGEWNGNNYIVYADVWQKGAEMGYDDGLDEFLKMISDNDITELNGENFYNLTFLQSYGGDINITEVEWDTPLTEELKEELEKYGGEYQLCEDGYHGIVDVVFKNGDILEIRVIVNDDEYILSKE